MSDRAEAPPASTYRVQLRPGFTLDDAAGRVDYLRRLGVGAVYASPILAAAPGSQHGYDVVDPTRVADVLGGESGRAALVARVRAAGLGLVADIVPNHMSVAEPAANPWWWDVLRNGPGSRFARCFDIDFARGPLLLPVLGDDGDDGRAELDLLGIADGCLTYHEHRYPLAPGTCAPGDDPLLVHERQHYRLVSWRRGDTELGYRRFFDVTTLAGVRVEDPAVFDATHAEILRWAAAGDVDGLRIDHPDGLADPGGYLRRLRARFGGWIVVEKILHPGEALPASWPVDGTTGYDALREVCGVFVDPGGEAPLTELAGELGAATDYAAVTAQARTQIAENVLVAEVRRIAALLPDAPRERGEDAVAALLTSFVPYRSYLPEGEPDWAAAVAGATARRPDLAAELAAIDAAVRADERGEPARRVQQTSGMVVAKGTEDTAFYRYTRCAALNEVGGSPDLFGVAPAEFHARAAEREASWPHTMTALSTHDTKRAEDVRARLAVLAEIPAEFAVAVRRWSAAAGLSEPSLDLLAWQTLLGAWPISAERLAAYLGKAAKEAKLRTSWTDPDPAFEAEVAAWPQRILGADGVGAEVAAFAARIEAPGWSNALGQKLVQVLGPGVPDVYQGTELWDLSLVDPDNRRPVDFAEREAVLARLEDGWLPEIDRSGAVKMHVLRQALHLRRDRDLSGYRPLAATGPAAGHVLSFARGPRCDTVAVAVRLPMGLAAAGGWRGTRLPLPGGAGEWRDLLTGHTLAPDRSDGFTAPALADLLARYPVALLTRD
ncbi:maltooligosyl trehalose synthase [Murinocardiopsis flavida]|uniref:Maltooligosyl trehalose synthase n=1 Tax=Murinocardiopsis flavida TaxID=645275 RepID=A0A2P8DLF6_9ACTN|nr:malto-oligosyltrehalose synthase [Murinocardiopsis flavida]PSK97991.1 maltooligosyl trehalose synthase [Murinocardiopsis flavida]